MRNVMEMKEFVATKALEDRFFKLSNQCQVQVIKNIISRSCWHGPVTNKWLEQEIKSQEHTAIPKMEMVPDHPIEDFFGSEIQIDDKYFTDQAGRVVLESNWEKYLIEVGGVEFFRAI